MQFRAGEVFWEFVANRRPLINEAEKANRDLGMLAKKGSDKYEDEFAAEKLGRNIGGGLKKGLKAGLVGSAAIVGSAFAFGAVIKSSLTATRQISDLADVAGLSAERFQELRFAANQVNSEFFDFEGAKLADIFKDVNDKFGDFFQTGAGPLADFFDQIAPKIGITKDAFRDLSGEQALGLYVRSLEQAGANQQDLSFFMEALGGDATALVPLFANGSSALDDFTQSAREGGLVLSNEVVQGAADADRKLDELSQRIRTGLTGAIVELAPEIESITADLIGFIPTLVTWTQEVINFAGEAATAFGELGERIKSVRDFGLGAFSDNDKKTELQLLQAQGREYEKLSDIIERQNKLKADFDPNSESDRRGTIFLQGEREKVEAEIKEINALIKGNEPKFQAIRGDLFADQNAAVSDAPQRSALPSVTPENIKDREAREKAETALIKAAQKEQEQILKDKVRNIEMLIGDAQTPLDEYQARLAELQAFESDVFIGPQVGAESFGRLRAEALVNLASETDDYIGSLKELMALTDSGLVSPDIADGTRAELEGLFQIAENERDRQEEAGRQKQFLMEAELQHSINLARLRGESGSKELEDAERRLEIERRVALLVGQGGLSEDDARTRATQEVGDIDFAAQQGNVNEFFKTGLTVGIRDGLGGVKDFLADRLQSAAANMFNPAIDLLSEGLTSLLSSVFSGGGGGGGLGGLLSSGIGSIFGFANGGLIGGRGGPRSDSNLIRASKGEFMMSAAAVESIGVNNLNAMNARGINGLPASGLSVSSGNMGAINMPINIDATGADAAQLQRVMLQIESMRQELPQRIMSIQRDVQDGLQ